MTIGQSLDRLTFKVVTFKVVTFKVVSFKVVTFDHLNHIRPRSQSNSGTMTSPDSDPSAIQVLFDLHGNISNQQASANQNEDLATLHQQTVATQAKDLIPGRPISMIRTLYTDATPNSSAILDVKEQPRKFLARTHVLQLQPTDRPIEDRFSVRLTEFSESTTAGRTPRRTRLQLGVYDGHRGPWTAQHACESIPEVLDDVTITVSRSSGRNPVNLPASSEAIVSKFEAFDRELLKGFTENNQPEPPVSKIRQHANRVSTMFGLGSPRKTQKQGRGTAAANLDHSHNEDERIHTEKRTAALRAFSGCTASLLLLDWQASSRRSDENHSVDTSDHEACLINLGDSRIVVAPLHNSLDPSTELWQTTDMNSSTAAERERLIKEHPHDDPRDIIVGKRLFGETLSTRALGDAHYKLPICDTEGSRDESAARRTLSVEEKALHRHYVRAFSNHLEAAAMKQGAAQDNDAAHTRRVRTLTLEERYDAMFSSYHSPPYVSATPDIRVWSVRNKSVDSTVDIEENQAPRRMLAILATDGLWDLIESEEAVGIVRELASVSRGSEAEPVNLAQGLLESIMRVKGRRPGDDVTILVVEYDTGGSL